MSERDVTSSHTTSAGHLKWPGMRTTKERERERERERETPGVEPDHPDSGDKTSRVRRESMSELGTPWSAWF